MPKKETINVQGTIITIISSKENDYISLTDMANAKSGRSRAADIIKNWIRTRTTLEFLGAWEQLIQGERLVQLNKVAITQMQSLMGNKNLKQLE